MTDKLKYKRKNPFVMLSHDFIKWDVLNWNEKDIYIILLMYADSEQKCFPSISTLCNVSGKSNKTVIKALKGLEEKHLLKKESRLTKSGQSSNLYTLYDFESVWEAESIEEVKSTVDEIEEQRMIEALTAKGYYISKEKELESTEPTKVTAEPSTKQSDTNYTTVNLIECQEENYTLEQIRQHYEYNIMIQDNPAQQPDIDSVMDILHTCLNTTKKTIRIAGEDKPTKVVISKLLKLTHEEIMYCIGKYLQQNNRIQNPTGYMTTLLYQAKEQMNLDVANQVSHDTAHNNIKE